MTDNEIIKVLEDYKNSKILQTENGVISIGDILNLINRQKAENEKLNIEIQAMRGVANSYKAEVERLQKAIKVQDIMIEQQDYKIEAIKSEAIKEFAERLKEISYLPNLSLTGEYVVDMSDIDNLVKEMT